MSSRICNSAGEADVFSLARFFSHRLEDFLSPFLVRLDELLARPLVARFRWWTSRGKEATSLQQVRLELLQWARSTFGPAVLYVFGRG